MNSRRRRQLSKSRTASNRFRLASERLEPKCLLAADISLDSSGQLTIFGDGSADRFAFQQLSTAAGVSLQVEVNGVATAYTNVRSVSFDAGGGDDEIEWLTSVDVPAQWRGGAGTDTFRVSALGNVPLSLNGDSSPGDSGVDRLIIAGGNFPQTTYSATGPNAGQLELGTALIQFTGLESIIDNSVATLRTVVASGNDDQIRVRAGIEAGTTTVESQNGTFVSFTFHSQGTNSLVVRAGAGNDSVEVATNAVQITVDGEADADTLSVSTASTATLRGGLGDDRFQLLPGGASFNGTIDGGGGIDQLDESSLTTSRQLRLTGSGAIDGFAGIDTTSGALGFFSNLEMLTGSSAVDSFQGLASGAATWTLDSTSAEYAPVGFGGRVLSLDGWENLQGGSGADTFRVATSAAADLFGNAGNDRFVFESNAILNGTIHGGSGQDELDFSSYATARVLQLNAFPSTDGFGGTDSSATVQALSTFTGIDLVTGSGMLGDQLRGAPADATWTIASTSNYATSGATLEHRGFETMVGGDGIDTFDVVATSIPITLRGGNADDVFRLGSAFPGTGGTLQAIDGFVSVNGDGGNDLLSIDASGDELPQTGTILGNNVNGLGLGAGLNFLNQEQVQVALGNAGSSLDLSFTGNATNLQILGGQGADSVTLRGTVRGNVDGAAGNDRFHFVGLATLQGQVDGGADEDTLDFSSPTSSAHSVTLTQIGDTDGFDGSDASLSGGFSNIDRLVGGPLADTLIGLNAVATWNVGANLSYVSGRSLSFEGFENLSGGMDRDSFQVEGTPSVNLNGGAGADEFRLTDAARVNGTIDGGADRDTLDLSLYASDVSVDLNLRTASIAQGEVRDIENVTGGSGNDWLTGNSLANTLDGGAGHDALQGGGGEDALIVTALAGATVDGGTEIDTVVVRGTSGADLLTAFDDRVTMGSAVADVVHFTNSESVRIEALAGNDQLVAQATEAGPSILLDGGDESDTVSAGDNDITWTVTGEGSGTATAGATASYVRVENLQGGSGQNTLVVDFSTLADATVPVVTIDADRVQVTAPTAQNPAPTPVNAIGMSAVLSTLAPTTTLLVNAIAPITATIGAGSTIVGPVVAGGASILLGASSALGGLIAGIVAATGGADAPQTTIHSVPAAGNPSSEPTKVESKNQQDRIRDDDDTCKAEYSIEAEGGTFEGPDCANAWSILGPNSGVLATLGLPKLFAGVGSLVGGSLIDTFTVAPGGSLTGSIDGGGPAIANSLTLTAGENDWTIDEANGGDVTGIAGGFENIATLTGGIGSDDFHLETGGSLSGLLSGGLGSNSLEGRDAPNDWTVTGLNAGTVTGLTLGFTSIGNLIGGNGPDSFSLVAGSLTGSIHGGAGSDTLTGLAAGASYTVDDDNAGTVTGVGDGYQEIENLVGSVGNDRFVINDGGQLSGSIDGGLGSNTLDAADGADTITVTGLNEGTFDPITSGYTNIGNIDAGEGDDTLVIEAFGRLTGSATGGDGDDSIENLGPATWTITDENEGRLSTVGNGWTAYETLVGGDQNDTFAFDEGGQLTGSIEGGGGINTVQGPNQDTQWTITAKNAGNLEVAGDSLVQNGYFEIQNLTGNEGIDVYEFELGASVEGTIDGGTSDAEDNTIFGPDEAKTWTIDDANEGSVADMVGSFSNIGNLVGGTMADLFVYANENGEISGVIDGGEQVENNLESYNTIQGPDVEVHWSVDGDSAGSLSTPAATTQYQQIANLVGGSQADVYTIDSQKPDARVLGKVDGGRQSHPGTRNTLERPTSIVEMTDWKVEGTDSGESFKVEGQKVTRLAAFENVANLEGGAGVDRFFFARNDDAKITGKLNGGAGNGFVVVNDILVGPEAELRWTVTDVNRGTLIRRRTNSPVIGEGFEGIEHLGGQKQADEFIFTSSGQITHLIDGDYTSQNVTNAATSHDVLRGPNLPWLWNMTGPGAGSAIQPDPIMTAVTKVNFQSIGRLVGGNQADQFTLPVANESWLVGGLDGGDNEASAVTGTVPPNRLMGPNQELFWTITQRNEGRVAIDASRPEWSLLEFRNIAEIVGGTEVDHVRIEDAGQLDGLLDGGSGRENPLMGPERTPIVWTVDSLNGGQWYEPNGFQPNTGLTGTLEPSLLKKGYQNFGSLQGSTVAPAVFVVGEAGKTSGIIEAGNGTIYVAGRSANEGSWRFTAANSGEFSIDGSLEWKFRDPGQIIDRSRTQRKTVILTPDGSLSGSISLGGTADLNTIRREVSLEATSWEISDANAGRVWKGTGDITSQNTILGQFDGVGHLIGSNQIDKFILGANARLNGRIVGGAGLPNQLTVSIINGHAHQWNVTGNRQGHVIDSVTQSLLFFEEIDQLSGGFGSDEFQIFGNQAAITRIDGGLSPAITDTLRMLTSAPLNWFLSGADSGVVAPSNLQFANVGNLVGSSGPDFFVLSQDAKWTGGTIDGNADTNHIVSQSAPTTKHNWILTAPNAGQYVGDQGFFPFKNIHYLNGGKGDDLFRFQRGLLYGSGAIDGGEGDDTLEQTEAVATTWTLTGPESGMVADATPETFEVHGQTVTTNLLLREGFSEIENILGGPATDVFDVQPNVNFTGDLNGGDGDDFIQINDGGRLSGVVGTGDGNDTIRLLGNGQVSGTVDGGTGVGDVVDFSNAPGPVTINLKDAIYAGVDRVIGNGVNTTLIGADLDNLWVIDGANAGSLNGMQFVGVTHLVGGALTDLFVAKPTGRLDGTIDGSTGTDTLDEGDFTTSREIVLLGPGLIDGYDGFEFQSPGWNFRNINTLRGSSATDTLSGANRLADWTLATGGGVYSSGNSIQFTSFENLTGGSLDDTFRVHATTQPVTLSGSSGNDRFLMGAPDRGVRDIQHAVRVNGGAGFDTLDVDDSASDTFVNGQLTSTAITGLRMASSGITYDGTTDQVAIKLGSGGAAFQVVSTSSLATSSIQTGAGNYALSVGTGGTTSVVTGIRGALEVRGGVGTTSLLVNDRGATQARTGTLATNVITGLGMGINGIGYSGIRDLELSLGSASDRITITGSGAIVSTTIRGGAGNDLLIANSQVTAPLRLFGDGGNDALFGGSGNDQLTVTARGGATATGGAGQDTLTVLGTSAADNLAVSSSQVRLNGSNVDTVNFGTVEALIVEALEGPDKIDVTATVAATTINAGSGDDLVQIGSQMPASGGTVNTMAGALEVNGQADNDSVVVDESGESAASIATLTANRLSGLGMGPNGLSYASIESFSLDLGSGDDTVTITGVSAPTRITGGRGNDTLSASSAVTTPLQLFGNAGNDQLTGGSGDDTLNAGEGRDSLFGAAGNDVLTIAVVGGNSADGGVGLDRLTVNATSGSDSVRITATQVELGGSSTDTVTYANIDELTVNTLTGADVVTVLGLGASMRTTIDVGFGNDTVQVRTGSDGIVNPVQILAGAGNDTLTVEDSTVSRASVGAMTSTNITGLGMSSSGLDYSLVENIRIFLGTAPAAINDFTVRSTPTNAVTTIQGSRNIDQFRVRSISGPTTISGGDNRDLFEVGSESRQLDSIAATLTILGSPPVDGVRLIVNDSGDSVDTPPNVGTLTANRLTGLGLGGDGLNFEGIDEFELYLGSNSDVLTVNQQQVPFNQNRVINRPLVDTAVGSIFVLGNPLPLSSGPMETWQFYQDNPGTANRRITPLLLQPIVTGAGPQWRVVGIGTTRTVRSVGLQRFAFGPVAGVSSGAGLYFGWKDGSPTGLDNAGVPEWNSNSTDSVIWLGGGKTNFSVNSTFAESGRFNRTYSIEPLVTAPTANTTIHAGDGADNISLQNISAPVRVVAGDGNDVVSIKDPWTIAMGVSGGAGTDRLTIDGSSDLTLPKRWELMPDNLSGHLSASVDDTGATLAPGAMNYDTVETLDMQLGAGIQSHTVSSATAVTSIPAYGQSFTPFTVSANDTTLPPAGTVMLQSFRATLAPGVTPPSRLYIYQTAPTLSALATGAGALGVGTLLNGSNGLYQFEGLGVPLDSTTKYFAVFPSLVRFGASVTNGYARGSALTDVRVADGRILEGLGGIDVGVDLAFRATFAAPTTMTIRDTSATTNTTIRANGAGSLWNVRGVSSPTTITGGPGSDLFVVGSNAPNGNGTLNAIRSTLTIEGGAFIGFDKLVVDSSGQAANTSGRLTSSGLSGLAMTGSINYLGMEALAIQLGSGDDRFQVDSSALGTRTSIESGPGNDVFTGNLRGLIIDSLLASSPVASRPVAAVAAPLTDSVFATLEEDEDWARANLL